MEKDHNLEAIKEYLKANGLDETLANSPVIAQKYSSDILFGEYKRQIRYFKKSNSLETVYGNENGCKKGETIRIKKEGNTILLEEINKFQKKSFTEMGDWELLNIMEKRTDYLDEKAENQLAREFRRNYENYPREIQEEDLYTIMAQVGYEVYNEVLKDKNLQDYPKVEMMRRINMLENEKQDEIFQIRRKSDMIDKTLKFAEEVKKSHIGKMFFGKEAEDILGEEK